MSIEVMVEEVGRLKATLDPGSSSSEEAQLEALGKLRAFGDLPTKVLSDTMIGKTVNALVTKSTLDSVKSLARELVDEWRQTHRKRKAAASGSEGLTRKLTRNDSCASMFSEKVEGVQPEPEAELKRKESMLSSPSLQRADSMLSVVADMPNSQEDPAAPKAMTPQRSKVLQKIREALGKEEEIETKGGDKETQSRMRDPGVLATEIEEALNSQLGDGKDNREYMSQARAVLFNLKDAKNPTFRFKLMVGFIEPDKVPKLSSEDMASDNKNAERQKMRKDAMEEIQSDWALKHGEQRITGMFTCGKCKGVKTTYFQMQTRSSDEPMTTFVTCLTCNNRWKFC